MCEWLADYGVGWVEDFIHPERWEEYAAVRAAQPGARSRPANSWRRTWEFERFIGMGCVPT